MRTFRTYLPLVFLVLAAGCTGDPAQEADESNLTQGNALLAWAPKLKLGASGTGFIEKGHFDAWALDLKAGDKIRVVETVNNATGEDLTPDFTLFLSGTKLESVSHTVEGNVLTKNYSVTQGGKYHLGVRAFERPGRGRYEIVAKCTGGPCNGEPNVVELNPEQSNACIALARKCAFDKLPQFNGAVGPAKARSTFEGCMSQAVLEDGSSCKKACSVTDAKTVCEGVIGILPFYADHLGACVDTLDECMETCSDPSNLEDPLDPVSAHAESMCLFTGLNSTCDSYARAHKRCGGTLVDGTSEQCKALCKATIGVWTDDLDNICTETCP